MRTRSLMRRLDRAEAVLRRRQQRPDPVLAALRRDPAQLLRRAGLVPDAWQARLLRAPARRLLLLCARQTGKSTLAAALALRTALLQPGAPVLLVSPSLRQSGELFRKTVELFGALGRPMGVVAETGERLELANDPKKGVPSPPKGGPVPQSARWRGGGSGRQTIGGGAVDGEKYPTGESEAAVFQ